MSSSYRTSFESLRSPMTTSPLTTVPASGLTFKTNIHRNKTKRWVEAPKIDYDGGWGDYSDNDDYESDDERPPPAATVLPVRSSSYAASPLYGERGGQLRNQSSFTRGDDGAVGQRSASGPIPMVRAMTAPVLQVQATIEAPPAQDTQGVSVIRVPVGANALSPRASSPGVMSGYTGQRQSVSPVSSMSRPSSTPSQGSQEDSVLPVDAQGQLFSRAPQPLKAPFGSTERLRQLGGELTLKPAIPLPSDVNNIPLPWTKTTEIEINEKRASPGDTAAPPASSTQVVEPAPQARILNPPPNVDKPIPPLPPLEDTSLETISEHDTNSVMSSPAFAPKTVAQAKSWSKSPTYDDFEDIYYEHTLRTQPPHAPHRELVGQPEYRQSPPLNSSPMASPPVLSPTTVASPPGSTLSKLRVIRPSDIYKRLQRDRASRSSEESLKQSVDSITRPSVDSQRTSTAESVRAPAAAVASPQRDSREVIEKHRPQPLNISPSSRQGREVLRAPSRGERSRSGGRSTTTTPPNPYLPPVSPLPTVPGTFEGSDDSEIGGGSWGDDILSVYTEPSPRDPDRKSDYFMPSAAPSELALSSGAPHAPGASLEELNAVNGRSFQDVVDTSFKRQDTLQPTPATSPGSYISPILPRQAETGSVSPSASLALSQSNSVAPTPLESNRVEQVSTPSDGKPISSNDSYQEENTRTSSPFVLPPVMSERSSLVEEINASESNVGTPQKATELDALFGELERAYTPDPGLEDSPTVKPAPSPSSNLMVPEPTNDPRQSMGVFSLYDSYWEDTEEPLPLPAPPIQPKSQLRSLPAEEIDSIPDVAHETPKKEALTSPKPPKSPKSPPPVTIPDPIPQTQGEESSPTPVSSVDEELLAMISAGKQFLNRRQSTATHPIHSEHAGKKEEPQENRKEPPLSTVPETEKDARSSPRLVPYPDPEGIEAIPPTKLLGPESEGIEAITGPTVEKRSPTQDQESPAIESEYAKELLNQFSRPQTLMLKDTMPMPVGMQIMPPMPPMPRKRESQAAPEMVNFETDESEKEHHLAEKVQKALNHETESEQNTGEERPGSKGLTAPPAAPGSASTPPPPPPPPEETKGPTVQTPAAAPAPQRPRAVFQDSRTIAELKTPSERIKANDALRADILAAPNELQDWVRYQMEHNNGEELLKSEIVTVRPETATTAKKGKNRMVLGHFPSHSSGHYHAGAEETKDVMEKMGRGAMKLGGWMKRVGKKGQGSKEGTDGDGGGVYQGTGEKGARTETTLGFAMSKLSLVGTKSSHTHGDRQRRGSVSSEVSTKIREKEMQSMASMATRPPPIPQQQRHERQPPKPPAIQTQFPSQPTVILRGSPSQPTLSSSARAVEENQNTPTLQSYNQSMRPVTSPQANSADTATPTQRVTPTQGRMESLRNMQQQSQLNSETSSVQLSKSEVSSSTNRPGSTTSNNPPTQASQEDDTELYTIPKPQNISVEKPLPQPTLRQYEEPVAQQAPLSETNPQGSAESGQSSQIPPPSSLHEQQPGQSNTINQVSEPTQQELGPEKPRRGSSRMMGKLAGFSHRRAVTSSSEVFQPIPTSPASTEQPAKSGMGGAIRRTSLLTNLGISRSSSATSMSNDAPPKRGSGSLLTKLGQKGKNKGKEKGHKKAFSDMFRPQTANSAASASARLAKANLAEGASSGAQNPANQSKIYDPRTGEYGSYAQPARTVQTVQQPYGPGSYAPHPAMIQHQYQQHQHQHQLQYQHQQRQSEYQQQVMPMYMEQPPVDMYGQAYAHGAYQQSTAGGEGGLSRHQSMASQSSQAQGHPMASQQQHSTAQLQGGYALPSRQQSMASQSSQAQGYPMASQQQHSTSQLQGGYAPPSRQQSMTSQSSQAQGYPMASQQQHSTSQLQEGYAPPSRQQSMTSQSSQAQGYPMASQQQHSTAQLQGGYASPSRQQSMTSQSSQAHGYPMASQQHPTSQLQGGYSSPSRQQSMTSQSSQAQGYPMASQQQHSTSQLQGGYASPSRQYGAPSITGSYTTPAPHPAYASPPQIYSPPQPPQSYPQQLILPSHIHSSSPPTSHAFPLPPTHHVYAAVVQQHPIAHHAEPPRAPSAPAHPPPQVPPSQSPEQQEQQLAVQQQQYSTPQHAPEQQQNETAATPPVPPPKDPHRRFSRTSMNTTDAAASPRTFHDSNSRSSPSSALPPRNSSLPAPDAEEKIVVEGERATGKGEKEKDESARRREEGGEGNKDDPASEGEDYCMSPTSYPGQAWEPAW